MSLLALDTKGVLREMGQGLTPPNDLMPGNITGDWDKLRLSHIKAKVIPVVQFPDGSARNDSTPLLQAKEDTHKKFFLMVEPRYVRVLPPFHVPLFASVNQMRWSGKLVQQALSSMLGILKQKVPGGILKHSAYHPTFLNKGYHHGALCSSFLNKGYKR